MAGATKSELERFFEAFAGLLASPAVDLHAGLADLTELHDKILAATRSRRPAGRPRTPVVAAPEEVFG